MATLYETQAFPEFRVCTDLRCWAKSIVIGGIVAGISFALFQMIVARVLEGTFFGPIRMIGAMVLGKQALDPTYPLSIAAPVGMTIHIMFSLLFATIFALFMANAVPLAGTTERRIFCGAIYGFALWVVNFFVIATFFDWTWFAQQTNPLWQGFFAHVFIYGAVLGSLMKPDY